MTKLRILGASTFLTLCLAIPVFADCEPPIPGQIPTPPCLTAQLTTDDSTSPGQIETMPDSQSVDLVTVAEDAITTLLLFAVNQ